MAVCCWCSQPLVQADLKGFIAWICPQEACYTRQIAHALVSKTAKEKQLHYRNVPLPKQVEFRERPEKYVLFGGAAGPGKSHEARWATYEFCQKVKNFRALILRETFGELERTHMDKMEVEQDVIGAVFTKSAHRMTFPATGAVIELGHMEDAAAVRKYLSAEYDLIVPDEAALYDPDALLSLSTRARTSNPEARALGFPKFWVVTNPGGPASQMLLDFFIDHTPDYDERPALKGKYNPAQWHFVPALLDDNPYIDPDYENQLAVEKPHRYQQLRYGNFRVFAGQFFPAWREDRHVQTIEVPKGCHWFRSMDWGYNAPGCVLWWAVLGDGRLLIRSEVKFQGDDVSEVAKKIQKRDAELGLQTRKVMTYADPAIWAKTGVAVKGKFQGESIGETFGALGVPMIGADNERKNGWTRCHQILRDAPDGQPWLLVHPDCRYLVRSIPSAKSDKNDPDDVDTKSDDHALDAWRYGAMSRPAPRSGTVPKQKAPEGSPAYYMAQMRQKVGRKWGRVA
jgi:hypothetical protein